jgi:hypothetical protein
MLDSLKKQQAKLTGRSMRLELQRRLSRLSHCEPLERSFKMDYEDTLRCLRLRSCLSSVFNAFHEGMEPPEQCDDPSHSATVTVRAMIIPRSDVLFDSWFKAFSTSLQVMGFRKPTEDGDDGTIFESIERLPDQTRGDNYSFMGST